MKTPKHKCRETLVSNPSLKRKQYQVHHQTVTRKPAKQNLSTNNKTQTLSKPNKHIGEVKPKLTKPIKKT